MEKGKEVMEWMESNKEKLAAGGIASACANVLFFLYRTYEVWAEVPEAVTQLKARVEAVSAFSADQIYVLERERDATGYTYYKRFVEALEDAQQATQELYMKATKASRKKDYALALVGLGAKKQLKLVDAVKFRLDKLIEEIRDRNLLAVAVHTKQTTDILLEQKMERDQNLSQIQNPMAIRYWRDNFGREASVSWNVFADALVLNVCRDVEVYLSAPAEKVEVVVMNTVTELKSLFDPRNSNEVTVFRYSHVTRDRTMVRIFNDALQKNADFQALRTHMQSQTPTRRIRASCMLLPGNLQLPASGFSSPVGASATVNALTDGPMPDMPAPRAGETSAASAYHAKSATYAF